MAVSLIIMIGRFGAFVGTNLIGFFLFNYCYLLFYIIPAYLLISMILSWFILIKMEEMEECQKLNK